MNFGTKVTILSPLSSQNIESFLDNVIRGPGETILTFASPDHQIAIRQWIFELCTELRKMSVNLGLETLQALEHPSTSLQSLGQTLADELNSFDKKPVILFINAFNRPLITDSFEEFFTPMVEHLGDGVRVAINSIAGVTPQMQFTTSSGINAVPRQPDVQNTTLLAPMTPQKPQLRVTAFGKGTASINGRDIAHWDGLLPKTLFFYFVDRTLLTRDQIFDDFWPQPQVTVKDATDIFHVTKHKVSEILNKGNQSSDEIDLTRYKQGLYIPSNKLDRSYDVADFETSLMCAERTDDNVEREGYLRYAIDLYKGPYLTSLETKWVIRRRAGLAHKFSEALIALGRLCVIKHETAEALHLFEQALTYRPEREDIRRAYIDLLAQSGEIEKATEAARSLELDVYRRLGMKIPAETLELFRRHNIHI